MKILLYDIETSPNIGYTWGKWETNVLSFIKEVEILCFAYKWLGESEIKWVSMEGQKNDKKVVTALHKLFEEADIVIAHNGDAFDQKISKARMLYHGLTPPRILQSIDTKKAAKNYFKFNGNGLDDLGQYLKLGRKQKHPGFDMWLGCLAGKRASWKQMISYNKQDVALLEKVYLRLKPWIHNHPKVSLIKGDCPSCGSDNVERRGFRSNRTTVQQQWHCRGCDSWHLTPIKR